MWYTDDPVADFEHYDAEQTLMEAKLPICSNCAEHITAEHFYDIGGEYICPDCMESDYRRCTDDYLE